MDLIDREKFINNYCKKQCDGDGIDCIYLNECKAIKSVREAQKVDAIPIGKVMHMIDEIQAEIEKYNSDRRWALSERDEKCLRCTDITFSRIQSIINEKVKEYTS